MYPLGSWPLPGGDLTSPGISLPAFALVAALLAVGCSTTEKQSGTSNASATDTLAALRALTATSSKDRVSRPSRPSKPIPSNLPPALARSTGVWYCERLVVAGEPIPLPLIDFIPLSPGAPVTRFPDPPMLAFVKDETFTVVTKSESISGSVQATKSDQVTLRVNQQKEIAFEPVNLSAVELLAQIAQALKQATRYEFDDRYLLFRSEDDQYSVRFQR